MLSECNVRNGGMAQMLHDAEARLESIDDLAYIFIELAVLSVGEF